MTQQSLIYSSHVQPSPPILGDCPHIERHPPPPSSGLFLGHSSSSPCSDYYLSSRLYMPPFQMLVFRDPLLSCRNSFQDLPTSCVSSCSATVPYLCHLLMNAWAISTLDYYEQCWGEHSYPSALRVYVFPFS